MASKRARAEARRRKARRKKLLVWTAMGLGVLALSVVIVTAFSSSDAAVGSTGVETWDLPALDGDHRVALADFGGKPTVAAFFASWCEICQRELPGFSALEDSIGEEVHFVGINTMNNGSGLAFARQNGIGDWPLARDVGQHDGRQLATNFGARGSPTTVLYDASGAVVDVTLGGMSADQLATNLQQFFGVTR